VFKFVQCIDATSCRVTGLLNYADGFKFKKEKKKQFIISSFYILPKFVPTWQKHVSWTLKSRILF